MKVMKRLFYSLLSVCFVTAAVSCSKENPVEPATKDSDVFEEESSSNLRHVIFSAYSSENSAPTRTELGNDNSVRFQEGDAISVLDATLGESEEDDRFVFREFKMVGSPDSYGNADFEGDVESDATSYFAFYPSSSACSVELINRRFRSIDIHSSIPSSQNAIQESFDPKANASVARSENVDGVDKLYFRNIGSIIKFYLPSDIEYSKVVFNSIGGEQISGDIVFQSNLNISVDDFNLDALRFNDVSDESASVTLAGEMVPGHYYYAVVAPNDYDKGLRITAYDKDDVSLGSRLIPKITLERSKIYNIGELNTDFPGSGTVSDPYRIYTYGHLKKLAEKMSSSETAEQYFSACYQQMADIDCNGDYIRIGGYYESDYHDRATPICFSGVYDGQSHSISNYKLKSQDDIYLENQYYGLFPHVKDASFYNMVLKPSSIFENPNPAQENIYDFYEVGALVGFVWTSGNSSGVTTIDNCSVEGYFTLYPKSGSTLIIGGLVGYAYDNVEMTYCVNNASFKVVSNSETICGGLIGMIKAPDGLFNYSTICKISRCRNNGRIYIDNGKCSQTIAGGIVGYCMDSNSCDVSLRIWDCVNYANVTAISSSPSEYCSAGGIFGCQQSDGNWTIWDGNIEPYLYNCLNKGDIFASGDDDDTYSGGILGYVCDNDTHLRLCVNTGTVSVSPDGIAGAITASYGDCMFCYHLDANNYYDTSSPIPDLPCSVSGSVKYCYFYNSLNEKSLNQRKNNWKMDGEEHEMIKDYSEWSPSQWESALFWKGSATFGSPDTLDLDFDE